MLGCVGRKVEGGEKKKKKKKKQKKRKEWDEKVQSFDEGGKNGRKEGGKVETAEYSQVQNNKTITAIFITSP